MKENNTNFEDEGFTIISDVFIPSEINTIERRIKKVLDDGVGTRNMLKLEWIRSLSDKLKHSPSIGKYLPTDSVSVQCTYFNKDKNTNWYVTPHRDLSIPVRKKIDSDAWTGWSVKEGVTFGQPPKSVLENLLIVRIHLELNNSENGALEVVPGSHNSEDNNGERIICEVPKGGALVMRPLLIHASSKLRIGTRRVLHFVFGPAKLPDQAEWAYGE